MKKVVLVCDKCGSTDSIFTYSLRGTGGAAPEYKGELCKNCYLELAQSIHAKRGKPQRGTRAPMQAVDYDTGKPIESP